MRVKQRFDPAYRGNCSHEGRTGTKTAPESKTDFCSVAFYYLLPATGDADLDGMANNADLGMLTAHFGMKTGCPYQAGDDKACLLRKRHNCCKIH